MQQKTQLKAGSWWADLELNQDSTDYESVALPLSYRPLISSRTNNFSISVYICQHSISSKVRLHALQHALLNSSVHMPWQGLLISGCVIVMR